MLKNTVTFFGAFLLSLQVYGQNKPVLAPSGLMCDLTGATDYQSINGYVTSGSASNLLNTDVQSVLISNKRPAFSWELKSAVPNIKQVAYQILIADNIRDLNEGNGNIWNSGKVPSAQSTAVVFAGKDLKPNSAYYWKVKYWDNQQKASGFSAPVTFYTGKILSDHSSPAYPLAITEEKPLKFSKSGQTFKADFGKAAFGQLRIRLFSDQENDSVRVRIGEVINSDGSINRKPPGKIRYAQYKLLLHKGWYTYQLKIDQDAINTKPAAIKMPPYIGEVTPFRYCEIEGYNHQFVPNDLTRLFVHYPFDDATANFRCSDTTLNKIWELCKYTVKATSFLGLYVDGDRERTPYEADTYINQLSHYAVDKEFTLARNSHEYLIDHPTWPTEWILQSVLIGWNDYLYSGDIGSLKFHYADIKAKSLMALEDSTQLISSLNGRLTQEVKNAIHFNGALKDIVDWPRKTETDNFVFTNYNSVVNAYYYRSLVLLQKIAIDLGKPADAEMFKQKAITVRKAYDRMFFDRTRHIYLDGVGTSHSSLHANIFALAFGLVDAKYQKDVLAYIKTKGMACSVYGAQFLLDAVYDAGDDEYGLSLLNQNNDRSWYNMIKVGSTITLEAWDNRYKPNQDWNHAWGAAPANIISRKLMGIEPLTPGWSRFSVRPQIGDLQNAMIDVPTIKGTIKVAYQQTANLFTINIDVPVNSECQIDLPFKTVKKYRVWLDDQEITDQVDKRTHLINKVSSGTHQVRIEW